MFSSFLSNPPSSSSKRNNNHPPNSNADLFFIPSSQIRAILKNILCYYEELNFPMKLPMRFSREEIISSVSFDLQLIYRVFGSSSSSSHQGETKQTTKQKQRSNNDPTCERSVSVVAFSLVLFKVFFVVPKIIFKLILTSLSFNNRSLICCLKRRIFSQQKMRWLTLP